MNNTEYFKLTYFNGMKRNELPNETKAMQQIGAKC